jgi:hypothetical protein
VTVLDVPAGWIGDPWAALPPDFIPLAPLFPAGAPFGASMFGVQRPQFFTCPQWVTSAGGECLEKAAEAGLFLDPWEAWFLINALGENDRGRWSSFAVKLICSRQNGKGAILEARELGGLFVFGEELLIHSAHRFNTAQEQYLRILSRIENTRSMIRKVARVPASHGEEGIELFPTPTVITGPGGKDVTVSRTPRLRFLARSKSAARGFTGDLIVLDEDMVLDADDVAAMIPSVQARGRMTAAGPQVWYMGSAGIGKESTQSAKVRRNGMKGGTSLCFAEWSVELHDDYCGRDCGNPAHLDPYDEATIAAANPGYGIRLEYDLAVAQRDNLGIEKWAQEVLGVGTYPSAADAWAVISERMWNAIRVRDARRPAGPVFAIDVAPMRASAAIGLCGMRDDGVRGIEVADHRRGAGWVVGAAVTLDHKFGPTTWIVDPRTDGGSLIGDLEDAGLKVEQMRAVDVAQAFGQLVDAVRSQPPQVAEYGDPGIRKAVAGADKRRISEGFGWDRVNAGVDITTIVAVTNAHWGHKRFGGDLDYDLGASVGYDVTEFIRYYMMGTYGQADLVRLASLGILRTADLGAIEQAGIPIPAGLAVRD